MADDTIRGRADHRAVEMFERLAQTAKENGRTVEQYEKLISAYVVADAARRWWERRGYTMPEGEVQNADRT